jgi:cobalt-zinc-cadmium efflux system membrane fusion protein
MTLLQCAAITFSLSLAASGCHKAPRAEPAPSPTAKVDGNRITLPADVTAVTVAPAQAVSRSRQTGPHLNGRLVWDEDETVRIYSPVAGRVRAVMGQVGNAVAANAPLALIDSPDFGQAQAEARKAEADLILAQRTLERAQELFAHGAAPRKDVDAAEDAVAGAEAEQQRAESRLTLFGARAGNVVDQSYLLRSPLAGVVVERNLNVGQELRPDLMLANAPQLLAPQFVVSDPHRLWVLLDVTEMDIGGLKPGQPLKLATRAIPGRRFDGVLESLGSSLDATTRTVKARGFVDNSSLLLRAEMYVDVEVELDTANTAAAEIASPAVISRGERNYVFVEIAPRVFERREVQVGPESAGKIFLLSGVHPGERILVEGSLLLEQLFETGGSS